MTDARPARSRDKSGEPEPLAAGLYIVATPIGNLGDITVRAADILARCDIIACEDTRVSQGLMRHLGLHKQLWRYDDHSGERDRDRLLDLARGGAVALISDAGTPLVSDPGYRLVRAARADGIAIITIPGPSAPIAALTVSGLPSDRFLFAGFLPTKEVPRTEILRELGPVRTTLIFFETAPRLARSLATIGRELPGRELAVARELTKFHEECRTGTAEELALHYGEHPPRGEVVLLIGPPLQSRASEADAWAMLGELLTTHKPSQAAAAVAKATGLDRGELYARALELRRS